MAPDQPHFDAKRIWKDQPTEAAAVTLANIQDRARKFQSQIQWRNRREYAAALLAALVFGSYLWIFPGWMMKAGSALLIVAALFVVWQLHKRAASVVLLTTAGLPLVDCHRAALIRQRDALKSVGTWYIAPFIPGSALLVLGRYFQVHVPGRTLAWDHQVIILTAIIIAFATGLVWLLNVLAAERLQRQIDQLDILRSTTSLDDGK